MTKSLLAALGCGLVLAACASTTTSTGTTASGDASDSASAATSTSSSASVVSTTGSSTVPMGEISGVARLYGGPMKLNGKMALDGSPGSDIHVTVHKSGETVATAVTGSDGTFTFSLPPGHYVVDGCVSFDVVVHDGQTTSHDLTCPVP
jgi:hypothetical protein